MVLELMHRDIKSFLLSPLCRSGMGIISFVCLFDLGGFGYVSFVVSGNPLCYQGSQKHPPFGRLS